MDALAVEQLRYTYPDGTAALADLSFRMTVGESVGLIGPNGAGKTSLFLCLAGVLPTNPGMIRVAGLDPAVPADRKRLPSKLGIVFQHSDDQLFCSTVAEDVAFGPLNLGLSKADAQLRVTEALERVQLSGFENRVPFHLSGGEKRRVALATVLAMRPEIVLLDEPSIFLDPRGRRELIRLLHEIAGTRIVASHDLDLILDTCQRVLVLDRGRLVAEGPSIEILANHELLEAHGLEVPWRLRT